MSSGIHVGGAEGQESESLGTLHVAVANPSTISN